MARLMLESGPNKCINRSARIGFHMVTLSARRAPGYTHTLDPRRASKASAMFGMPSQTANISTLLEAKKRSSFVN